MEHVEASGSGVCFRLVGGPVLSVAGKPVTVPEGSIRLLVLVALRGRRLPRSTAARLLWPDVGTKRAAGNLRSAVWRIRCSGADVFDDDDPQTLVLAPGVWVDLDDLVARASRRTPLSPAEAATLLPHALAALDLLPGWYDEWLLPEKERIRDLLLRALESMTRVLARSGRGADAVEAALALVGQDPLCESAQIALITSHLREGNLCEARRSFRSYAQLLREELGVRPSEQLQRLVSLGFQTAQPRAAAAAREPRSTAAPGIVPGRLSSPTRVRATSAAS